MTTEIPDSDVDRDATASTIYCIETDKNLSRLIHDMLHTSKTVDKYLKKLEGLIRIFWGTVTPENKLLDQVIWLHVMVQILPTECLIPIFKESQLTLENDIENNKECNRDSE